jgi:hypothetical protein
MRTKDKMKCPELQTSGQQNFYNLKILRIAEGETWPGIGRIYLAQPWDTVHSLVCLLENLPFH